MCIFDQPEVLWDVLNESQLEINNPIYKELSRYINLSKWISDFNQLYEKWLNEDLDDIYDLSNPVNATMITAINKFNQLNNEVMLFLWYDVDRSLNENFQWEICPISGYKLIDLGPDYHFNNRFISPVVPLIFPCSRES